MCFCWFALDIRGGLMYLKYIVYCFLLLLLLITAVSLRNRTNLGWEMKPWFGSRESSNMLSQCHWTSGQNECLVVWTCFLELAAEEPKATVSRKINSQGADDRWKPHLPHPPTLSPARSRHHWWSGSWWWNPSCTLCWESPRLYQRGVLETRRQLLQQSTGNSFTLSWSIYQHNSDRPVYY